MLKTNRFFSMLLSGTSCPPNKATNLGTWCVWRRACPTCTCAVLASRTSCVANPAPPTSPHASVWIVPNRTINHRCSRHCNNPSTAIKPWRMPTPKKWWRRNCTASRESDVFLCCFALCIDLLTDTVQPLSRCYDTFHAKGKRRHHVWSTIVARVPNEEEQVLLAKRKKHHSDNNDDDGALSLVVVGDALIVEEENPTVPPPPTAIVSTSVLPPETTTTNNTNTTTTTNNNNTNTNTTTTKKSALLPIQRHVCRDPAWIGFASPARLCCEHFPLQVKGDVQCMDCGGDIFCYTCFDRLHQKGLRQHHTEYKTLELAPAGAPPKPYCEMPVMDHDEVRERILSRRETKTQPGDKKDVIRERRRKHEQEEQEDLTILQRIHRLKLERKNHKKKRKRKDTGTTTGAFEEGIEYRECGRPVYHVSVLLHGEMTMEEKRKEYAVAHPDSETEEEEEQVEEEERGKKKRKLNKKESKKSKKSKKNKKNKKSKKSKKSKTNKTNKTTGQSSSPSSKKKKKEQLPPNINKNLLMRMELPRFTGGLPVVSLELSGRLYLSPDLGMQLVHPEFLDETWFAVKEEYDHHVKHLEHLENQVNKKKTAVDLAARMRDRASVLVAAKARKRKADTELKKARLAMEPVEEKYLTLKHQQFTTLAIVVPTGGKNTQWLLPCGDDGGTICTTMFHTVYSMRDTVWRCLTLCIPCFFVCFQINSLPEN